MADNRRGKDKRYYFTLGQMVLLGAAFTLTALVIFVLGIFIGKGIEARKMIRPEEPLIKMPVKPSTQGSARTAGAAPKEELTFYETLTKSPQNQSGVEEKLKDKVPAKALKPDVKEAGPQSHKGVLPVAEAVPGTKESGKSVKSEVKDGKTEAKGNDPGATRKTEKGMPAAEVAKANLPPENGAPNETSKTWSVQLNAFPDERSAKQLVDRLKNKGYNAVISEARNKGKVWYRVRVGKYNSREEADKALANLKTKENFEKAFATSRP